MRIKTYGCLIRLKIRDLRYAFYDCGCRLIPYLHGPICMINSCTVQALYKYQPYITHIQTDFQATNLKVLQPKQVFSSSGAPLRSHCPLCQVWHRRSYQTYGTNRTDLRCGTRREYETLTAKCGEIPEITFMWGYIPVRQIVSHSTNLKDNSLYADVDPCCSPRQIGPKFQVEFGHQASRTLGVLAFWFNLVNEIIRS